MASAPRPGPDDRESFGRALALLQTYSVDCTRIAEGTLGRGDIENRDVQLLMMLRHGPASPTALARAADTFGSVVSRSLGRLERDGLVARRHESSDRRLVRVSLTVQGRRRVARFGDRLADYFAAGAPLVKESLDLLDRAPTGSPAPGVAGAAALDVVERLARVGAAYVADVSEPLARYGIHANSDRRALAFLAYRGAMRPAGLADDLGISRSAVSALLDRMESAGLITRRHAADNGDRRAVTVTLTARGTRAAQQQRRVFAAHADDILDAIALTLG